MADEPRVARLHLVPAAEQAGDEAPVVDLGGLRLVGRGAEPHRAVGLAAVEQTGNPPGPASGGSARVASIEQGDPPDPTSVGSTRVAAVDQSGNPAGPGSPGSGRVAAVEEPDASPGPGRHVRSAVDLGRAGAAAERPVRVARLGPVTDDRSSGGSRRRASIGSAPDGGAPRTDRRAVEPDGAGRSPARRARGPAGRSRSGPEGARTGTGTALTSDTSAGAATVPAGETRTGGRTPRAGLAGEADALASPAPSDDDGRGPQQAPSAGRRRPPGPKQIDPGADPVVAAKDICLDLLSTRARTKHELADALRRRGVPDEAAATALDRFDEVGLIDDAAFAGQWVRSRQRSKGLARRALAVELRRKGVDDEVAGEALAEVDATAEEVRARELVDRKLRTVPADTPEQRTSAARRLVGMLARKGYSGGIAYRVVREALAAHGADVDELGSEPPED